MKAIQVAELASALGVKLARPPLAVRPQSPLQDPSTGDVSTRTARPEQQAAQPGTIENVASIAAAGPGSLVFAEDAATLEAALSSLAGAILLPEKLTGGLTHLPGTAACGPVLLLADQPRLAFAHAARLLRPLQDSGGVHASAVVAGDAQVGHGVTIEALAVVEPQASIGADSSIGAGAIIGAGVSIGTGCRIYPRVVLYPGTQLGDRVVVHAGAVLGADGFGYVRDRQTGAYLQFPQQGTLVIEDDVEIGANTTIDRGALEETRIRRGTKLDNLVHIGHNVDVGEDVVIAAQTGVSGSSTIGRGAVIAGQVGIADHVTIGEGAILGAQCGVPSRKRLQGAGVLFWGTPARPIQQYLRELASLARLSRAGRVKAGHDRVPAHKQEED